MRIPLRKVSEDIAAARANFERVLERWRLACGTPRFSAGLRDKLKRRLDMFLEELRPWLPFALSQVTRFTGPSGTFAKTLRPDRRTILHVPSSPALRLSPESEGFLLRATFETDIQDPRVLAAVKASIEGYWRGRFELNGKTRGLRTEIAFKTLAPDENFSPDGLRLTDGGGREYINRAGAWGILLAGKLEHATPAHEFGHVIGLADEYIETYDAEARSGVHTQFPGSLMGSRTGKILPRHLKKACLLLRRHNFGATLSATSESAEKSKERPPSPDRL
ncbi:MAG: hypothetical protein PHF00_07745 [Elusimicrobia bacterium]|nr:hypothetical protein [Elusimicrobiota bacterium]